MSNLWDTSRLKPNPDIVVPGETMTAVFWNAVALRGPKVAMRQKKLGLWREWTWAATAEAVREIGDGLLALGFNAGDCASILSNTVVEWVLADLAVLSCGGVSSGIYPTDAPAQVEYLCFDSRTQVLFVEDDEQLDKALDLAKKAETYGFSHVWTFDSHILWQEPYVIYSQILAATRNIIVGPMVTNPATRDWTVTASTYATLNEMYGLIRLLCPSALR